ncbi:MAG: Xaa-Pro peptidase family protein [Candidatus Bathyarchaeota archaeon]|jgi:Xaa-Pro aminopeptidase|nr:Xaa-Pro peptidase family protein [Candidatus Bathyarchaeota archaeon]MDP7207978.1 Xaa-Pro peptidase family protein [Candidatus Bathyarchaeota archaeon]MDP7442839.1 Xaa-Pro peptidase family protein [Candidatus Bathyarchaeota archaeon]
MVKLRISRSEYRRRISDIRKVMEERGLDALLLTRGKSMFYLSHFSHITTERPAILLVPPDGDLVFLGPLLEADHLGHQTDLIGEVRTYLDYPGDVHPIDKFSEWLIDLGYGKSKIGTDNPAGAAGIMGYTGPPLPEKMPDAEFERAGDILWEMRLRKSEEEVALIRESAKWGNLAHQFLQDYSSPGRWDVEVSLMASMEASSIMKKTLGSEYETLTRRSPASAGFRGQVGWKSAMPHSIGTPKMIEKGDVLVTGAGSDVGGYCSELERTMIVGEPTPKMKNYFRVMMESQDAAIEALGPGVKCSEVDKASGNVIRDAGYTALMRHHTGHGIGLEGHEPPWLDIGNDSELQPGMVVSIEPGIYELGYAGFRHSDTAVITEDGCELLTYYPRDIESLTIQ